MESNRNTWNHINQINVESHKLNQTETNRKKSKLGRAKDEDELLSSASNPESNRNAWNHMYRIKLEILEPNQTGIAHTEPD